MDSIKELRDKGYKVKVGHHRVFGQRNREQQWEVPTGILRDGKSVDNILTRREFEEAKANLQLSQYNGLTYVTLMDAKYGDHVYPTGGFTQVVITTPDGRTLQGKFNFGATRPYNKKIGSRAALGRALKTGGMK